MMLLYQKQETVGCGKNICLIILSTNSVLNKEYNKCASLLLLVIPFILSDKNINSICNLNQLLNFFYDLFLLEYD